MCIPNLNTTIVRLRKFNWIKNPLNNCFNCFDSVESRSTSTFWIRSGLNLNSFFHPEMEHWLKTDESRSVLQTSVSSEFPYTEPGRFCCHKHSGPRFYTSVKKKTPLNKCLFSLCYINDSVPYIQARKHCQHFGVGLLSNRELKPFVFKRRIRVKGEYEELLSVATVYSRRWRHCSANPTNRWPSRAWRCRIGSSGFTF